MDKKHELIKLEVQKCYDEIKHYEEKLEELRANCDHPLTKLCNYSTGPGRIYSDTEICSICGEVVQWKENPQQAIWTATGHGAHVESMSDVDGNYTKWNVLPDPIFHPKEEHNKETEEINSDEEDAGNNG